MAGKKKATVTAEGEVIGDAPGAVAAPEKDSITLKIVKNIPYGPKLGTTRTFSKSEHGADYKAAAKAWQDRFEAVEA